MLERRRDGRVRRRRICRRTALRDGTNTMGYYTREDLPFFHALADAFTICDHYHCSVIGPTDPNRMYTMSATIDPDGNDGGPSLQTLVTNREQQFGKFTWRDLSRAAAGRGDQLEDLLDARRRLRRQRAAVLQGLPGRPAARRERVRPQFPTEFLADCAAGTLPQVSWILARWCDSEHPPAPVTYGEVALSRSAERARLEPGGVGEDGAVRHLRRERRVLRPRAAAGAARRDAGRVPDRRTAAGDRRRHPRADRAGLPRADARDLAVLARRLRVLGTRSTTPRCCASSNGASGREVPNLSRWRRKHTGDMTQAFNFAARADPLGAGAADARRCADPRVLGSDCPTQAPDTGSAEFPTVQGYPLPPPPQTMPVQEKGKRAAPERLLGPPARPAAARRRPPPLSRRATTRSARVPESPALPPSRRSGPTRGRRYMGRGRSPARSGCARRR